MSRSEMVVRERPRTKAGQVSLGVVVVFGLCVGLPLLLFFGLGLVGVLLYWVGG